MIVANISRSQRVRLETTAKQEVRHLASASSRHDRKEPARQKVQTACVYQQKNIVQKYSSLGLRFRIAHRILCSHARSERVEMLWVGGFHDGPYHTDFNSTISVQNKSPLRLQNWLDSKKQATPWRATLQESQRTEISSQPLQDQTRWCRADDVVHYESQDSSGITGHSVFSSQLLLFFTTSQQPS